MQVQRKEITTTDVFEFTKESNEYLVKNFSDEDILVYFDEDAVDDNKIKIESGFGQKVVDVEFVHKKVYVDGNGEVEVQQV